MTIKRKTRRLLAGMVIAAALLIAGAIAATFYLMQSVFEADHLLDPNTIPKVISDSWQAEFPGAGEVQWKYDEELFEAKFNWQGKEDVEAYFNDAGVCLKKEFPTEFKNLPLKAREYLNAQTGYRVEDIEHLEEVGSEAAYEVELIGKVSEYDCLFDAQGNLISRIRDGAVLDQPPPPRMIPADSSP